MAQSHPGKPSPRSKGTPELIAEPEKVMLRRVNVRLILGTFGLVAVLALSVHLVHGVQVENNADKLKERALVAEQDGDFPKALQLFGQYLRFREDDLDTQLRFVRLRDGLAGSGQTLSAVLFGYEDILRRDPERPDAAEIRHDIAAVAMSIREFSVALQHLTALLEEASFQEFRLQRSELLPDLLFYEATCHHAEGRVVKAWEKYLQVLALNPGDHKYYLPVALLLNDEYKSLPRQVPPDPAQNPAPPATIPEQLRALLPVENQRDFSARDAADRTLELMLTHSRSKPEALLARARVLHQRRRFADARQDVDAARALAPVGKPLLLFSAQLAVDQAHDARFRGRDTQYYQWIAQGRQDVEAGFAHDPNEARFHLLQAQIERETLEGVRFLPATAEKSGPATTPRVPTKLTDPLKQLQWTIHEREQAALDSGLEAIKQTQAAIKTQTPQRTSLRIKQPSESLTSFQLHQLALQLRWSLSDTLISQGELFPDPKSPARTAAAKRAQAEIAAMNQAAAPRGMIDFLQARLQMAERQWKDAAWNLEQTRIRLATQTALINRIDLLLDQCYGRMGNPDQQIHVFLRALRENPNWLPAVVRLPDAYLKANRADDALKALERIKGLPGVSHQLARLHLRKELGKPVDSRQFNKISALLDAENSSQATDPTAGAILRAEVLALEAAQLEAQNKPAESQEKYLAARNTLDEALASHPETSELWSARTLLELKLPIPADRTAEERIRAAEVLLEKAHQQVGDQVVLRATAVQIAGLLPYQDAWRELEALERPAFSAEEQPLLLEGLARSYAILGLRTADETEKSDCSKKIVELKTQRARLQSDELDPQIELAELAFGSKDLKTIQTAIDRATRIEGPNGPSGNYLRSLKIFAQTDLSAPLKAAAREQLDQARPLLKQAMKDRPYWAVLPRTQGNLETALGNQDAAVAFYQQAYQLGDRSRDMISRIVDYYARRQQVEQVDEFLRQVALDTPLLISGELARRQWQVAWQLQRYDEAIGVAGTLASKSRDYRDHVWESRLRFSRGERGERVEKPLLDACQLAPQEPDAWLALVGYYARTNNPDKAKAAIQDAQAKLAKDPPTRLPLTLARCYELLNDRPTAEKHYQAALKLTKPDSAEFVSLQAALADFYTRSPATDPKQQAGDLQQATALLDQLLKSTKTKTVPQATQDWARRRRALLTASSGRYDDTERALNVLAKGQSDEDEVSPEDLRVEAKILLSRNRRRDYPAVIKLLETLEEKNAINAQEELALARLYESTDQWPKAQAKFQKLLDGLPVTEKIARGTMLAEYSIALLSRKDVDQKELLAEAEPLVKELEKIEPDSFRAVTTRAMLFSRQGQGEQAVPILKNYVARLNVISPEQAFRDLVQQKKIDEALDSLKSHLDEKSAQQIVDHVRALLAKGDETEALAVLGRYVQVSDVVQGVQTTLIRVIARFLEEIEQFPAAEETYRLFVSRSKQPEAVLQLAAFLARRDRIDAALDVCDAAWKTCDPPQVAKVAVGTLRRIKPTPTQIQRVEVQLADAVEQAASDQQVNLLTILADLRDLQGRYAESIGIYQDMLKQNPQHGVALNNLAWLLSYQSEAHVDALNMINLAIRLYGPSGGLLDTRGMIHLRRGQTAKALQDLNQAVQDVPASAIYFHLAQAQLAAGNQAAAKQAFLEARAKDLDPITDLHVLETADYERLAKLFD